MNEDSLTNRVYNAAKNGNAMTLYVLLSDLSSARANEIINETVAEGYSEYTPRHHGRYTPLMIAAECSHERVFKMLLSEFEPDLEKEGIIFYHPSDDDEMVMEGATALWCAARSGYLKGVELLVEAGADVNHATRTNVTPLRMACREGHLGVVKYLTDHSADVNIADIHNGTCLMFTAKRGHLHVMNFLLKKKVDPNVQDICGSTALHYAAGYNHMSILKTLLNYNAHFFVNKIGMTPIKEAASEGCGEIVEYLFNQSEISKEEKIEALELLGATHAYCDYNYWITKTYKHLHQAMKMRYSDPDNIIEKKLIKPIPAYENWVESRNLSELEALERNTNGLDMEGLTIRERILGVHNPKVSYFLMFRGDLFAREGRFDRSFELHLHAVYLKQSNKISTADDLLKCAMLLKHMLHIGMEVTYDNVVQALAAAIVELERSKSTIASPAPDGNHPLKKDIETCMTATLNMLTILTRLFNKCNEEERSNVNRMVFLLNHLHVKSNDGKTLLHMACDTATRMKRYDHTACYPCPDTVQLLIRCGADVNATDYSRNTPFDLIVTQQNSISNLMIIQVIRNLSEGGAHIYCLINKDKTFLDSSRASIAEILKTEECLSVTSLKCIAAIAVKLHGLSYQGQVPQALEYFIELHDATYRETSSD